MNKLIAAHAPFSKNNQSRKLSRPDTSKSPDASTLKRTCATRRAPRSNRTLSVRVKGPNHAALLTRPAQDRYHPLSSALKSPFLSSRQPPLCPSKVASPVVAQSVVLTP